MYILAFKTKPLVYLKFSLAFYYDTPLKKVIQQPGPGLKNKEPVQEQIMP